MGKIEWLEMPGRTPETWNPIRGCSPVSRKCDHCWARAMARRGMHEGDAEIRGWDIVHHCKANDVPVFVKQLGAFARAGNLNAMAWPDFTIARAQGEGGASGRMVLQHPKGADMTEWPYELRVREWSGGFRHG